MSDTKNESENNLNDTIEQILGLVRRRRWWIVCASSLIPLAVVGVALKLPDQYVSQATLLLVQQEVSQRYVEPDNTTTVPTAVQAMELEFLSRTRLLGIINDLNLYPGLKDHSPEQLVAAMRKDIDVQALESAPGRNDFNGFTIAFSANSALLAQEVTRRLTSLFIEESLQTQGERAANTTKFLGGQLEAAKQRLAEQEQRLQAFKTSNLGELPEDQATNLAQLTDVHERLETVAASLAQVQAQQGTLLTPLEDRLSRLQTERDDLLKHYTSRYPEVVKKDREIGKVRAALDQLKNHAPSPSTRDTDLDINSGDDPTLAGIIRQAENNAASISNLSEQEQKLRVESEQYQKRLNLAPVREQQLSEILRDYDVFKQDYATLQKEKMEADLRNSLETNQEGQHFRLVDPPTLPLKPSSPKRLKICLGGVGAGVLLGLALAFVIDMRNGSFYTPKAVAQAFAVPVVVGLPTLASLPERRRRGWTLALEWVVGSVMILAMLGAQLYVFRHG